MSPSRTAKSVRVGAGAVMTDLLPRLLSLIGRRAGGIVPHGRTGWLVALRAPAAGPRAGRRAPRAGEGGGGPPPPGGPGGPGGGAEQRPGGGGGGAPRP